MTSFLILLRIEWLSEVRKRNTLLSLLLYLISIYFIIYQIDQVQLLQPVAIIAIYWVIQLFIHVWIAFESMQSESARRMLFWYQKISFTTFFLTKCTYNGIVILMLSNLIWFVCSTIFLHDIKSSLHLYVLFSIVNSCFMMIFTFLAYVVFMVQKQIGLVSILGIPLLIPTIMITMKFIKFILQQDKFASISVWEYMPAYLILTIIPIFCGLYLLPYLKHN